MKTMKQPNKVRRVRIVNKTPLFKQLHTFAAKQKTEVAQNATTIELCVQLAKQEKKTAFGVYINVKGISTKKIADYFGVTQGAVNLWVHGKVMPHVRSNAVNESKRKIEDFMSILGIDNCKDVARLLDANYSGLQK